MQLKETRAVVEVAVKAAADVAAGADDTAGMTVLVDWAERNLENGSAQSAARRQALAENVEAYAYLMRTLRVAATTVECRTGPTEEMLCLFALPVFLTQRDPAKPARVMHWEVRCAVERRMEEVMGLPMMSVRLNAFPVEPTSLANLSPAEQRRVLRDLHTYGDSKLLSLPLLEPDDGMCGLLWVGIVRFQQKTFARDVAQFRTRATGASAQTFVRSASERVSRALAELGTGWGAAVHAPVGFPDALSSYRLLKLNRYVRARVSNDVCSILYRLQRGLLTMWLVGEEGRFLGVIEQDHTEDAPSLVRKTLARLEARHGVPCEEVAYFPPLPREAAYPRVS